MLENSHAPTTVVRNRGLRRKRDPGVHRWRGRGFRPSAVRVRGALSPFASSIVWRLDHGIHNPDYRRSRLHSFLAA